MEILITNRLEEFVRDKYYNELLTAIRDDESLVIDFNDLDRFDPVLADQLLEEPEQVLKQFEEAVSNLEGVKVHVRVKNLPERRTIRIRSLRAKHLGKLLTIDTIVKSASEVKPQVQEAIFQCPECGSRITMPQEGNVLQKPYQCECGRRGDFDIVEKKMIDIRWLFGVEPFELTTGERPGEISIFLKEELTTPRMQRKTDPGNRLKIVGILKELPKRIKGKMSTRMDMYIDAVYVEPSEIEFEELDITEEDEKLIKDLASDPNIYEKLKASVAPAIYGFDEIKESLVLQMFGGNRKILPDGTIIRGNIHILITGDPGVGKSVIGSSRILHNSDKSPEYTTISELIDKQLEKNKIFYSGAEVSLNNDEKIKVLSLGKKGKAEWKPVKAFIRHRSPEYLIKITTRSGREVIATEDHSFVTLDDHGNIVSLKGSEISSKNFLPIPVDMHKEMIKEIDIEQKIVTNAKKINKIKLDWKSGFFFGIFLAEGSISNGTIFIDSRSSSVKEIIKNFVISIGLKPNLDDKRIFISSRNLVRFLEKKFYKGEKLKKGKGSGAVRKSLPEFCFFAPKEFIYGLLSGMYSGDGYFVNAFFNKGNRKLGNLKIGYTTTSEDLALRLVEILAGVGIFALLRRKIYSYKGEKRTAFEITVLGRHAEKLLKSVRLVDKKPQISRFSEKDAFDIIPCGKLLYEIVMLLGYSKKLHPEAEKRRSFAAMMRTVRKRNKIGRRRLERTYRILLEEAQKQNNLPAKEKLEKLRSLIESNIIWDQVIKVEKILSKEKYVYDLSINENETFVVNNLIVHNTQLLKLVSSIVPRSRYVSGSGVTGAGMTATVVKNEAIGGWVLEAGALILCNKGLISIDEFDKISRDDQIAMHEATSAETVSIAKASIVATLPAQTAVLAGANPKFGRFDPFRSIVEQLDIPETLLSRFDLKYALRDIPDKTKDERLADHIIISRVNPQAIEPIVDKNLLRKYIAYAKQITDIELTPEAAELFKKFYVDMRSRYATEEVPTVSITLRQYEALIRLAEASAKIRLDTKMHVEDAERAIRLMQYSLSQLGYDIETGRIDIDKIESGITAGRRRKIVDVLGIIDRLQREVGREVAIDDVKATAEEAGLGDIDETLEHLKREGMIYEPRPGFIRKI